MKYKSICLMVILSSINYVQAQLHAVKEWSAIYDGPAHGVDLPAAAVMDKHANFYITGRSSGENSGQDFATIKYSPSGQQVLTLRYNSPANSWDESNSLAVDDSGNIYVAGSSSVTSSRQEIILIKYMPSGVVAWEAHFSSDTINSATTSKVVLDSSGNIFLGGSCGRQMLMLKYSPSGVLLRSMTVGDDSTGHRVADLLVANNGVIYLAGSRSYMLPGNDVPTVECAVVKVDTQGTMLWKRCIKAESAYSIHLDLQNDLVLITQGDGTTAKFSPNGQLRWYKNSQNSSPSIMILTGLDIDSRNRIIVTGYGCVVGCFDYITLWYDADGNVLHYQSYNSPDTLRDFCMASAVDKFDNVYLTGTSAAGYSDGRCLTLKYDSSGNRVWETTFSIAPNAIDEGQFIVVNDSGCVYIGGSSVTTNGWDYLVIKYRQDSGTSVKEPVGTFPFSFALAQNFPNPFNLSTTFSFSLPSNSFVSLKVFDLLGREVATVISEEMLAGSYSKQWSATKISSGIYFYRLQEGSYIETKKLILLK